MIHSTKKDQYWSFWCQVSSNHQDQEFLWGNRALEAGKTSKVVEAAEVSKALKITSENFRVIQVLEFYNLGNDKYYFIFMFWKKKSNRIIKNHVEFYQLFCWRLLRPTYAMFLKTGWWNSNIQPSGCQNHLQTKYNLHIFIHQTQITFVSSLWDTL